MDRNNSVDNTMPNTSMFVIKALNPMETPGR